MTESLSYASRRRILTATVAALATAIVILFTAVLPAEYGIDPLGTGRALGLTALAEAEARDPLRNVPAVPISPAAIYKDDVYTIELRPFEGVEYKYRLEQGASLVYAWQATGKVEFEFHGEPDGAPAKYFDSYSKGADVNANGGFIAAKPGIHGWFWKNPGATRITVTLRTSGFYSASTEYRNGDRIERKFADR